MEKYYFTVYGPGYGIVFSHKVAVSYTNTNGKNLGGADLVKI
jgi:hypothetical protein